MSAPSRQGNPWAFWAPSSDEFIAGALRLARVGPGNRFLDLGCGDGRVLIAAARLGAHVRGIEIDPEVADIARCNLAAAEVPGRVDVDDIYSAALDADVIYAYLTPVTLSRLSSRFAGSPTGTRLVTPRYAVAGWEPSAFEEDCYLYETPVRSQCVSSAPGWPWRAAVIALPADRRVLVPISFTATPEAFVLELDPQLGRAAKYATGDFEPGAPRCHVPVDLIFERQGAGSVVAGSIRAQGMDATVAAVFSPNLRGQWNFHAGEGHEFRQKLDQVIASARAGARGLPQ